MKLSEYLAEERGRGAAIAKLIGVAPQQLYQWAADRPVPMERCIPIERATNRLVTCEELRPDLDEDWAFLRAKQDEVKAEAA